MVFRIYFLLFLTVPTLTVAQSNMGQKSAEIGITGGMLWYNGELNPSRQFYSMNPAGGILYRHNFNYRYSFRAMGIYGNLGASDLSTQNGFQLQRGLSFTSPLTEVSGVIEFNFLPYEIGEGRYPFTTYIFGGFSVFKMNPQPSSAGSFQNLASEPGKKFSPIQPAIPFGFGLKVSLFRRVGIFAEWGMRKTFTDYMDDVSTVWIQPENTLLGFQRGNSKNNDWYSYAGAGIVYLLKKKNSCPAYNK